MPIYSYKCNKCKHSLEARQSIHDKNLTKCPACHQESLLKVFLAPAISFKGSGFYINDSKAKTTTSSSPAPTNVPSPSV